MPIKDDYQIFDVNSIIKVMKLRIQKKVNTFHPQLQVTMEVQHINSKEIHLRQTLVNANEF